MNTALNKGAYPILTTSISRRESDASLEAYVNAAKELGRELGLPVIDLYGKVNGYINRVGAEKAKDIYNYVNPKDSRFMNMSEGDFTKSQYYAGGTTDDTHINYYGAQIISQWFCDELERIGHPLSGNDWRSGHTTRESDIPAYSDESPAGIDLADSPQTYTVTGDYDNTLGTVEISVDSVTVQSPSPSISPDPTPSDPPLPSISPDLTPSDPPPSECPDVTDSPQPEEYRVTDVSFGEAGPTVRYTAGTGNAVMAAASYDRGVLVNAGIFAVDKSGEQTVDYVPAGDETKVFIWSDMNNMVPLCEAYRVQTPSR